MDDVVDGLLSGTREHQIGHRGLESLADKLRRWRRLTKVYPASVVVCEYNLG